MSKIIDFMWSGGQALLFLVILFGPFLVAIFTETWYILLIVPLTTHISFSYFGWTVHNGMAKYSWTAAGEIGEMSFRRYITIKTKQMFEEIKDNE